MEMLENSSYPPCPECSSSQSGEVFEGVLGRRFGNVSLTGDSSNRREFKCVEITRRSGLGGGQWEAGGFSLFSSI